MEDWLQVNKEMNQISWKIINSLVWNALSTVQNALFIHWMIARQRDIVHGKGRRLTRYNIDFFPIAAANNLQAHNQSHPHGVS